MKEGEQQVLEIIPAGQETASGVLSQNVRGIVRGVPNRQIRPLPDNFK